MEIKPQDIQQLKNLITSPQWKVFLQISEKVVQRIGETSSLGATNDETLKETYLKEGKIQGIKQLIQEIFNIASQE